MHRAAGPAGCDCAREEQHRSPARGVSLSLGRAGGRGDWPLGAVRDGGSARGQDAPEPGHRRRGEPARALVSARDRRSSQPQPQLHWLSPRVAGTARYDATVLKARPCASIDEYTDGPSWEAYVHYIGWGKRCVDGPVSLQRSMLTAVRCGA